MQFNCNFKLSIKSKIFALLLIQLAIFYSCKSNIEKYDSVDEYYNLNYADEGTLSDVFSEVELTPLQYGGETYPSEINVLTVTPDVTLIETNKNILHVFDHDGSYLSCSSEKMGEGPEEHLFSMGFGLNKYNGHIEVLSPNRLTIYDKNFNFVSSSKIPDNNISNRGDRFFRSIYSLSDTTHLLQPIGSSLYFVEYNSRTKELGKKVLDTTPDIIAPLAYQTHHFFTMPDGEELFVSDEMTCKVYSFDSDNMSIRPKIQFELGDEAITRQKIERLGFNESELAAFLLKCDDDLLSRTMLTSGNIVALVKKGWTLRTMYTVFIDRNTGKKVRVNMFKNDKRTSPMFGDVSEGYAYAAMLKEEIMDAPELLLDKADRIDSIMQNVEDDTFILMKYKFK